MRARACPLHRRLIQSKTYSMQSKQSGKTGTIVVAAIMFAIAVGSNFSRQLLIEQGGKFAIFGNLGILIAIGLLWRWKYIGKIVSVLSSLTILAILMSMVMTKSISIPFLILLAGLSVAFYLTTFSPPVNDYLNKVGE